jgi:hypothetical protein
VCRTLVVASEGDADLSQRVLQVVRQVNEIYGGGTTADETKAVKVEDPAEAAAQASGGVTKVTKAYYGHVPVDEIKVLQSLPKEEQTRRSTSRKRPRSSSVSDGGPRLANLPRYRQLGVGEALARGDLEAARMFRVPVPDT